MTGVRLHCEEVTLTRRMLFVALEMTLEAPIKVHGFGRIMEPEPVPVSKELVYLAPCGAILSKALHLCQAGFGLGANSELKLSEASRSAVA